jgi:hypothetical protein
MRGPTCVFWANLTAFSLKAQARLSAETASVAEEEAATALSKRSAGFEYVKEDRDKRAKEFKARFSSVGTFSRFMSLLRLGLGKAVLPKLTTLTLMVVLRVGCNAFYMNQIETMFRALFSRNKALLLRATVFMLAQGVVATAVTTIQKKTEREMQIDLQKGLVTAGAPRGARLH